MSSAAGFTPTREDYLAQHKERLAWMPWLYASLRGELREAIRAWQHELQARLVALECVTFGEGCFVAPDARLFAEPKRGITVGDGVTIASGAFLHGPIVLEAGASVNARVSMDGGAAGVVIGAGSRIATGATLYAFDHGLAADAPIAEQRTRSRGIRVGRDVWIGAGAGVTDGVSLGDGSVVGMGAVVTRDVDPWVIVGGSPARPIGRRR
jgi:acetyltransferase-like isoleucine patch superfamily enzyme